MMKMENEMNVNVPLEVVKASEIGLLDAGQGAGVEVHNSRLGLWMKKPSPP